MKLRHVVLASLLAACGGAPEPAPTGPPDQFRFRDDSIVRAEPAPAYEPAGDAVEPAGDPTHRIELVEEEPPVRHVESIEEFREPLEPYGNWEDVPDHGSVWVPHEPDYVPYSNGYWAHTTWGWTWISHDPFGWAVSHYGRWVWLNGRWAWVPDVVWGPAWVEWRYGDGWVGWAPLTIGYAGYPRHCWRFVTVHSFLHDRYYVYARDPVIDRCYRRTRPVHRHTRDPRGREYVAGPEPSRFARHGRVRKAEVKPAPRIEHKPPPPVTPVAPAGPRPVLPAPKVAAPTFQPAPARIPDRVPEAIPTPSAAPTPAEVPGAGFQPAPVQPPPVITPPAEAAKKRRPPDPKKPLWGGVRPIDKPDQAEKRAPGAKKAERPERRVRPKARPAPRRAPKPTVAPARIQPRPEAAEPQPKKKAVEKKKKSAAKPRIQKKKARPAIQPKPAKEEPKKD